MESIFLARVQTQRDNGPHKPNVIGQWVTKNGFSTKVEDAQIFTSLARVRARTPRFWQFEVQEFTFGHFFPGPAVE
jgi:hypothetical protein